MHTGKKLSVAIRKTIFITTCLTNCRERKNLQLYPNWEGHKFTTELFIKKLLTIKPKSKKQLSQQRSLHTTRHVSLFPVTQWNFHYIIPTESHMSYNEEIGHIPYNNSDVVTLCSYHSEVYSVSPSTTQAVTWNTELFCLYLCTKPVTKDVHTTFAQKVLQRHWWVILTEVIGINLMLQYFFFSSLCLNLISYFYNQHVL